MINIDTSLNEAIDTSSNVRLSSGANWWFCRETQRKYIFNIAAELLTTHNVTPSEAMELGEELVQLFYTRHVQPSTRIQ